MRETIARGLSGHTPQQVTDRSGGSVSTFGGALGEKAGEGDGTDGDS